MTDESMSYLEALKEIKRLKEALEQQPCEDCISRQAVKQVIIDSIADLEYESENREMQGIIDKLPSVTPKEKIGHWVNAKVGKLFPSNDYKCSECGNILDFDGVNCGRGDANYCPNCGCHMVEPQGS